MARPYQRDVNSVHVVVERRFASLISNDSRPSSAPPSPPSVLSYSYCVAYSLLSPHQLHLFNLVVGPSYEISPVVPNSICQSLNSWDVSVVAVKLKYLSTTNGGRVPISRSFAIKSISTSFVPTILPSMVFLWLMPGNISTGGN